MAEAALSVGEHSKTEVGVPEVRDRREGRSARPKPMAEAALSVGEHSKTEVGVPEPEARDRREAVPDKKRGRTIYKGPWTPKEDEILKTLIANAEKLCTTTTQCAQKTKMWVQVGEAMFQRNGKQCRERWLNHLNPDIRKGVWSAVRKFMPELEDTSQFLLI
jgi:hypothetical protein